jgi:hypothetical protein
MAHRVRSRPREVGKPGAADDKEAEITSKRRMCTTFACWRTCARRSCRRDHICLGDPFACFARYWDGHPKAFQAWIVAAGDARAAGLTIRHAMRTADGEVPGGSGRAALPWVRPYLKSFDKVAGPRERSAP